MRKIFTSFVAVFFAALLVLPVCAYNMWEVPTRVQILADDASTSGELTKTITWRIDGDTLYVEGTGDMPKAGIYDSPWNDYKTAIKKVIVGEGITTVCPYFCSDMTELLEVQLPEGITLIGTDAFYGCTNLSVINIPNTVKTINGQCFYLCSSLKNVLLPEGLETIDDAAFGYCGIESITLPESLLELGGYAFTNTLLKEIYIPSNVKFEINPFIKNEINPFIGCKELSAITVSPDNKSCLSIDGVLYKNNSDGLIDLMHYPHNKQDTSYTIPGNVNTVMESAFDENPFIKNVTFQADIYMIDKAAFKECSSLEQVELHGVENLELDAFYNCAALKNINLSKVKSIGHSAFEKSGLTGEVNLESCEFLGSDAFSQSQNITSVRTSVKSIGRSAFELCRSLKTIILDEGVEEIDVMAFDKINNGTVYLPSTLKSIGYYSLRTHGGNTYYNGCQGMWDKIDIHSTCDFDKVITIPHEPDENGICRLCGEEIPPFLPGDLNSSGGDPDVLDGVVMQRILASLEPEITAADLNRDGIVNVADGVVMQRILAGLE